MDLSKLSKEELQKELYRREALENAAPRPLDEPNYSDLRRTVIEGTNEFALTGHEDSDFEHYVYEEAIKAIYGPGYFDWYNKRGKD